MLKNNYRDMKKIFVLVLGLFMGMSAFSQTQYAEFNGKQSIWSMKYNFKVDGEKFSSLTDALNYKAKDGWVLDQFYVRAGLFTANMQVIIKKEK